MIRPKDISLAKNLERGLLNYSKRTRPLRGIRQKAIRQVLIEQLVESAHRVKYPGVMLGRDISPRRADPSDIMFDPLLAAIYHKRSGRIEEAFWLIFLFVHFGKNSRGGWRYAREVYGALGTRRWDWARTSTNPAAFRKWLHTNRARLERKGVPGGFGNHRKYESLDALSGNGTGAAVESYVNWVAPPRTHQQMVGQALTQAGNDPRAAFRSLYGSMAVVRKFGRIARFDYLAMLGKIQLANIEPSSAFVGGATGPSIGANLLFSGRANSKLSHPDLDSWLLELDQTLRVGMQAMEDALCNWQKSPSKFKAFRG